MAVESVGLLLLRGGYGVDSAGLLQSDVSRACSLADCCYFGGGMGWIP